MIILDMNQISLANVMMNFHMNKSRVEEDMVRHMILNSIRMYRTMFKDEYGEIVLAYDLDIIGEEIFFHNTKE